ncbi:MAG: UDP-N-acetylmuramate--L-alanine ligase [Clostridiales bacterium]|nr:UDP-N-acetylmuramate--L-alanine ligase [Clostridiales bacterium]
MTKDFPDLEFQQGINNDTSKAAKKVHFIGIGGISMSGLAEILKVRGCDVTGSDMKASGITDKLRSMGIPVSEGHSCEFVEGSDLVIYTAAVKESNPELMLARQLGIPSIDRATLLGRIMKGYPCNIAVSGTHGKTTTTSMISMIMLEAQKDPTIHVGGELSFIGGTTRLGGNEYFVMEADEYCQSFLKFHPFIAVILNMEFDHPDFYRDLEHIRDTFHQFASLVPENGYIVSLSDDPAITSLLSDVNCNRITYGLENPDSTWSASNISYDSLGCASYDLMKSGVKDIHIQLQVPGRHNVLNSLAAIAACTLAGCETAVAARALGKYAGTRRRFELKGQVDDIKVIDDYAHHPSEVRATLTAASNCSQKGIWCVFQPHTYTRTKHLMNDFANAFGHADRLIVTDIYAAREKDTGEVNSGMLVELINSVRSKSEGMKKALYIKSFDEAAAYLADNVAPGELVITMGAGDVYKIGEKFLETRQAD